MNEPKVSIYKAEPGNEMGPAYFGRLYVWLPDRIGGRAGYVLLPTHLDGDDPDEVRARMVALWEEGVAKERRLTDARARASVNAGELNRARAEARRAANGE